MSIYIGKYTENPLDKLTFKGRKIKEKIEDRLLYFCSLSIRYYKAK
ncbi:hypothetical protein HMPREF9441_03555 [Paraprevotella clara YIT 11840]|uniref:Uncharacterized protein n=1 Tax=Paraprevotella clara YIT 11840 TaxID=762968 RepID=G5SVY3_9BACT|nr:hypothetical protein HMPREF9441_03555 [Paraprevotella clara YIT 11840]